MDALKFSSGEISSVVSQWLAVAGATLAVCVVYGVAYSYGQFFGPISNTFHSSQGAGSLIFSVTVLLGFGLSVGTGPLSDRMGARAMLAMGGLVLGAGLMATAAAGTLWQAYISYGVGSGLGLACVYVPVLAAIGRMFDAKRALATGIVVTGVGIGTLLGSPIAASLISTFGWRQAYFIFGAGAMLLLLVSTVLIGPRKNTSSPVASSQNKRDKQFRMLYGSTILINVVIYVPYVHLSFAAQKLGIDPVAAAGLVSAIGFSNISGRLAVGVLAQKVSALGLFRLAYLGLSLSYVAWIFSSGYVGLLLFAIVFGASHGAYSALIPTVVADKFGTTNLGRDLGILFTALGLGSAVGAPLIGFLVDFTSSYTYPFLGLIAIGLSGAWILSARTK